MNADDRLTGDAVDLKPLIGLLRGLPEALIERLTVDALREHRQLVAHAEHLFDELPADVKAGKEDGGDAQIRYFKATIAMHAQMSALTTLISILGYTPKA
jgi:hypothetical protein